mgnify:CR=1 FL=1
MSLKNQFIESSSESTDESLSFNRKESDSFSDYEDISTDSDSELKVLLKYGYIIELDGTTDIRLDPGNNKILDMGLITGITQNNELVDAYFLGNEFMEENNVKFDKQFVHANNKKYRYQDLRIHMTPSEALILSKESNDFILKLDDETYEMFSSVIGNNSGNTCIISVIDSKVSACCISDGEVLWISPIDIGKNKFDEDNNQIITENKKFSLDNCYLRVCIKNIYLHTDMEGPDSTLILGKTKNPLYKNINNNFNYKV